MSEALRAEVDLGENGGRRLFLSYSDLRDFISEEREAWRWMRGAHEPSGHQNYLPDRIEGLSQTFEQEVAQGRSLQQIVDQLPAWFLPTGNSILHHESAHGSAILDIRDRVSPEAATFAYSFYRGWAGIQQAQTPDLLRGVVAFSSPETFGHSGLADNFAKERAIYRAELRRLMKQAQLGEENRAAALDAAFRAGRKSVLRWAGKRALRWRHASTEHALNTNAAIAEIDAVKKTYEESMKLQAPSKYWRDKAAVHKEAESVAAVRLAAFFVIATLGMALAFYKTATFFLKADTDPRNSVYFVASAGLATVAGLVLWIGRLLTRLYLSEHHLRKDAEERRIMTTTYLALMRKGAAGEVDRQVILSALFRSSSDGIVKDDGATDFGLSAVVSRMGMPGRAG